MNYPASRRVNVIHGVETPDPYSSGTDRFTGHGAGKPTSKIIDEQADRWAFLVQTLGIDWPPGECRT